MLSLCPEFTPSDVRLQYWKVPRMLYECSQNACGIAAKYGSNVEKFVQNAAGIFRLYFKWTINVKCMSRMYQKYDRTISRSAKMLPNLALS